MASIRARSRQRRFKIRIIVQKPSFTYQVCQQTTYKANGS